MPLPTPDRITEWKGGSLDELIEMLSGPAIAARIEVLATAGGRDEHAGEVHIIAGGVAESFADEARGDEALDRLRGIMPARFRVEPRLPDPKSGALEPAGPEDGSLADRPFVTLMRYCEEYVMTCLLEVWRGGDHAAINYRKGEMVSATVNGNDTPERMPEVMTWSSGSYRIVLPPLVLPRPKRISAPDARTLFGYPAPATPSPPAAPRPLPETLPRDTKSLVPATDPRETSPGLPVAVFDTLLPERTTETGIPATAPQAAAAAKVTVHQLDEAPTTPFAPPEVVPDVRSAPLIEMPPLTTLPEPAALPDRTAPQAVHSTTPGFSPAGGTTTPGFPQTSPRRRPTPARTGATRRTALRKRSIYDLPLLVHIGLGLGLGLAIVGAYLLVQNVLAR